MKKWISMMLVLVLVSFISLTACDEDEKGKKDGLGMTLTDENVTIYIPESATASQGLTAQITFEDGWQNKETFAATYNSPQGNWTVNCGDKTSSTEYPTHTITVDYDIQGRIVRQEVVYTQQSGNVTKSETVSSYDQYGRKLVEEQTTYYSDSTAPFTTKWQYTYETTASGSIGTASTGYGGSRLTYDQDYRLVGNVIIGNNGQEISRVEISYDEHGNRVKEVSYSMGELTNTTTYTYRTVQISPERAAQMPYFKQK